MNLPQRRKRPRMMAPKPDSPIRCAGHLAWTRGNACCLAGKRVAGHNAMHVCQGRPEAHHVKGFMDGGMSRKPGDDKVIPVCSWAHAEIHNAGAETVEKRYGVSLTAIAERNWQASPHGQKYRRDHQELGI